MSARPDFDARVRAVLRPIAALPLPFVLLFLGLAAGALSIESHGLSLARPDGLQVAKALVLGATVLIGIPSIWSRRMWLRTLGHAVAALATSSGAAHGVVWALIGRNGGLDGTGPRAPDWLVGLFLLGAALSATGFVAVVVLVVRDLRRERPA